MFDYTAAGAKPADSTTVWSRSPLQPLAGGLLTPLSASVITELMRRAWFLYYDRLGFNPPPLTRMIRNHQGRLYLNMSVSARLDAEQAALEPLMLRVNGESCPLATVEKPGFLAGFKVRRKQRQVETLAKSLAQDLPGIVQKAEIWCAKALEMRWTQAEVLQIMEEIEQVGLDGMMAFFAARHNLERLYNRLLWATQARTPYPANVLLINNALSDLRELVEVEMVRAVVELSDHYAQLPAAAEWFKSCDYRHWKEDAPAEKVQEALDGFLNDYGHRGLNEGELAHARWYEERDPVLRCIHACIKYEAKPPAKIPAVQAVQHLLESVEAADRKEAENWLQQIRRWHTIQSQALHALAYIWTGTRHWALAAAREAGVDGRVVNADDIFYYELEEIKQMMTGEWNISDLEGIHAVCAERRADYARRQSVEPGEILVGDGEGVAVQTGLPAVPGHATGPLRHWNEARKNGCRDAIAAAHVLDSGWALVLPIIHGAVSEGGSPVDPFVAAARVWHRPTVVALGADYGKLIEGALTTIDGEQAQVEQ